MEGFWPEGPDLPIVFCDVIGEENEAVIGSLGQKRVGIESKHNITEAKKVVSQLSIVMKM